jgi:hypothetical protein
VQGTSLTKTFTINFVLISRELELCDSTETPRGMSVDEQDSVFGETTNVEMLDTVPFGNSDTDDGESGTE